MELRVATLNEMEEAQMSSAYAEFIMERGKGDCPICNGGMLLEAIEDGYLFEEFLNTIGLTDE